MQEYGYKFVGDDQLSKSAKTAQQSIQSLDAALENLEKQTKQNEDAEKKFADGAQNLIKLLKRNKNNINKLSQEHRALAQSIRGGSSPAAQELDKVMKSQEGLRGFGSQLAAIAKTPAGAAIAAVTTVVVAAGVAFAAASARAASFETKLAEIQTIADRAEFSTQKITQITFDLAKVYGSNINDNAGALYQTISAGASTAAEASERLTAAQTLSIGGLADIQTSVTGLASVLNAYKGANLGAADAADTLFTGVKTGITTVPELSTALGRVTPIAAQLGVSFQDLVAAVSAITANGVSTAEAVTQVRSSLVSVLNQAGPTKEAAKELNIEFSEGALRAKGYARFMQDVIKASGGSATKLKQLFGETEAVSGAMNLAANNGKNFEGSLRAQANRAEAAREAQERMLDTVAGQARRFDAMKDAGIAALGAVFTESVNAKETLKAVNEVMADILDVLTSPGFKSGVDKTFGVLKTMGQAVYNQYKPIADLMGFIARQVGIIGDSLPDGPQVNQNAGNFRNTVLVPQTEKPKGETEEEKKAREKRQKAWVAAMRKVYGELGQELSKTAAAQEKLNRAREAGQRASLLDSVKGNKKAVEAALRTTELERSEALQGLRQSQSQLEALNQQIVEASQSRNLTKLEQLKQALALERAAYQEHISAVIGLERQQTNLVKEERRIAREENQKAAEAEEKAAQARKARAEQDQKDMQARAALTAGLVANFATSMTSALMDSENRGKAALKALVQVTGQAVQSMIALMLQQAATKSATGKTEILTNAAVGGSAVGADAASKFGVLAPLIAPPLIGAMFAIIAAMTDKFHQGGVMVGGRNKGLGPGEYYATLRQGEAVIPTSRTRTTDDGPRGGNGGGGHMNVSVNLGVLGNPGAARFRETTRRDILPSINDVVSSGGGRIGSRRRATYGRTKRF